MSALTALSPNPITPHKPGQGLNFGALFDRHLPKVGASESCKVLSRCEPVQVLVGADVVVENPKFIHRRLQCCAAGNDKLFEQGLEGAKQAFNPAVLPRCVLLRGLVLNAHQSEERGEHPAVKNGFIVGTQAPRFTVLCNRQTQVPQHRPTTAVYEGVQTQGQTTAVVDDANGSMCLLLGAGEEGQIHRPDVVHIHSARLGRSNLAAQLSNLMLVGGNQFSHKGFAHAQTRMQAIEGAGHRTTARARHVGLKAQDLATQPVRFAAHRVYGWQHASFGAADKCRWWAWRPHPMRPKPQQHTHEYQIHQGKMFSFVNRRILIDHSASVLSELSHEQEFISHHF